MTRSTREVIEDHLERAKNGDLEGDLAANCAEDIVVISHQGVGRGWDFIREMAALLMKDLPGQIFTYHAVHIEGEYGYLLWSGESEHSRIPFGTDTYIVRDGKIVAQTWYYVVEEKK